MAEQYLEVDERGLTAHARVVRRAGTDLADAADRIDAHAGALTVMGPFGPTMLPPSGELVSALGALQADVGAALRRIKQDTTILATAMTLAARRYEGADVLPVHRR